MCTHAPIPSAPGTAHGPHPNRLGRMTCGPPTYCGRAALKPLTTDRERPTSMPAASPPPWGTVAPTSDPCSPTSTTPFFWWQSQNLTPRPALCPCPPVPCRARAVPCVPCPAGKKEARWHETPKQAGFGGLAYVDRVSQLVAIVPCTRHNPVARCNRLRAIPRQTLIPT